MLQLHTLEELQNYIRQDGVSLLEIASIHCAPCVSIQRKIAEWSKEHPDISTACLEIESVPEAARELQILTAPAVLVYIDGKVCIKQVGYFSLDEVFCQIERYLSMM